MKRTNRNYENELTFLEVAYSAGYHRGYINEAGSWMNDDEYYEYYESSQIRIVREGKRRAASMRI